MTSRSGDGSSRPPGPTVSGFSPISGSRGTSVVITGGNLTGATGVYFNSMAVNATFTVDSATQITATVPGGATTGPIRVQGPGGSGTSTNTFSVVSSNLPTITGLSPPSGRVGSDISIRGSNFTGVTAVDFNGTAASFTVTSDVVISATVPAGATEGPVHVANTLGTANSPLDFLVVTPPALSGFSPQMGTQGTSVVITGTLLSLVSGVRFNGRPATFSVAGDTQITTSVPPGATTGPIQLSSPLGAVSSTSAFTVLSTALPTVTSVSPTMGSPGGDVTVEGTGFTGATAVTFNGTPAIPFTVNSDTVLFTKVPPGTTTGPVVVTNQLGSSTSAVTFTVP